MLVVELVPEPAEGAFALDGRASLRPARSSVMASAKSAMSWVLDQDGSGSMQTRSSSSRSTGVWPSMPGFGYRIRKSQGCLFADRAV